MAPSSKPDATAGCVYRLCRPDVMTSFAALATGAGNRLAVLQIEGTCIKHRFGKCSIKMYDKCGIVLRIETTANDVSFSKRH